MIPAGTPHFQELEQLRTWHLARLRKQAVDEAAGASSRTPAGLMLADRETLEQLIEARVSAQLNPVDRSSFEPPLWSISTWQVLVIAAFVYAIAIGSAMYPEAGTQLQTLCAFAVSIGTTLLLLGNIVSIKRLERAKKTLLPTLDSRTRSQQTNASTEELIARSVMQIAKLKERERLIADYSANVSCSVDVNLNIRCATPASLREWGYTFESLLKRPLKELIYPADWSAAEAAFGKAMQNPGESTVDLRMLRADQSPLDLRWSIEWSRTEGSFFATTVDVSSEKQIERLKQEFVTLLSHDLRAPLNSICLVLDMFRQGVFGDITDGGQKRLQMIKENIAMLQNIIGDLIDVHALEQERQVMQPEVTDTEELVNNAVNLVSANAQFKKITLTNGVTEHHTVRVDPVRMVRVLTNLLSNAVKFTSENGAISVTSSVEGSKVVISVSDTGCGLSHEQLSNVFQPYWQAQEANARQGSGLGLYGSRMIVEAHGGSMEVKSEVDKGSSFTVKLPLYTE